MQKEILNPLARMFLQGGYDVSKGATATVSLLGQAPEQAGPGSGGRRRAGGDGGDVEDVSLDAALDAGMDDIINRDVSQIVVSWAPNKPLAAEEALA